MRGLASRSEWLGGRAGPGPVDNSEGLGDLAWLKEVRGLGAGLARALSIKVIGSGSGLANRSEGSGTARPLADTVPRGLARDIPDF